MTHKRFYAALLRTVTVLASACGGEMESDDGLLGTEEASLLPGDEEPPEPGYEPPPIPMVHNGSASVISEFMVYLTAGVPVTFETTNVSAGDPVLHLMTDVGVAVAVNDNGAGGARARLTYTPQVSRWHILIVRAKSRYTKGVCDITKDSALFKSGVAFGGLDLYLKGLRTHEQIETVRLPNGAGPAHSLYILKSNGLGIEARITSGGTSGGVYYKAPVDLGDRKAIVGVWFNSAPWSMSKPPINTPGAVRLIRNDASIWNHDFDGDGLGNELELALGTCKQKSGWATGPDGVAFDCNQIADARDSDGDGIHDRREVLGRRDVCCMHQPLALWGADPRHKDMFVEVDYEFMSQDGPPQKMQPANARLFAQYYAGEIGDFSTGRLSLQGKSLRNPDGKHGILVHLDTGVPPENANDATIYGDWGGYNAVPYVQQSNGNWDSTLDWKTHMQPARRGIFRYYQSHNGGAHFHLTDPHQTIETFQWMGSIDDVTDAVRLSAEASGLSHAGRANGSVVEPLFKPNYPSLLNLATRFASLPPTVGFSDGIDGVDLNNTALTEHAAVLGGDPAYLDWLEDAFGYWVDRSTGDVDWNRDGVMAPEGTTVRAYANYVSGSGYCESSHYNALPLNATTDVSPAVVRFQGRIYLFHAAPDGTLKYQWSADTFECPVPDVTPCGTFTGTGTLNVDADLGVDAAVFSNAWGNDELLVVAAGSDLVLREAHLSLSGSTEVWTAPATIPGSSANTGEPSLASHGSQQEFVLLAFRGMDGNVRTNLLDSGGWLGETVAMDEDGGAIPIAGFASPSIVEAYLPSLGIYGAFAAPDGSIDIWKYDTNDTWQRTELLENPPGPVRGRPAMAWVPETTQGYPGRLYLMLGQELPSYTDPAEVNLEIPMMMMSYVKVTKNLDGMVTDKSLKVGFRAWWWNGRGSAFGMDLLSDFGNLRATVAKYYPDGQVWFYPKSDGILDYTYGNHDDWEVLGIGICHQVVNPGGLVTNPIQCRPKIW